jgi:protein transport protein SEC13
MAVAVAQFDTGHTDLVHDTQFDYYGRRLASCSSDGLIRVFSVEQEPAQHCADLMGHQGPVWQVAWAHPKFGNVLASASFDHTVIVWKEAQDGSWEILHRTENYLHTGVFVHVLCTIFVTLRLVPFTSSHLMQYISALRYLPP